MKGICRECGLRLGTPAPYPVGVWIGEYIVCGRERVCTDPFRDWRGITEEKIEAARTRGEEA